MMRMAKRFPGPSRQEFERADFRDRRYSVREKEDANQEDGENGRQRADQENDPHPIFFIEKSFPKVHGFFFIS